MYRKITTAAVASTVAFAALAVPTTNAHAHDGHNHYELTSSERQVIVQATARFHDEATAIAAGYIPTDACAAIPGVGGMGFHYVNPANLMDGVIDPAKPEILMFVPDGDGGRSLAGVEYFQRDADQSPVTSDDRPALFGKYHFDGPMPEHEPGMGWHYDLHVWVYKKNPAGDMAAWNPKVSC